MFSDLRYFPFELATVLCGAFIGLASLKVKSRLGVLLGIVCIIMLIFAALRRPIFGIETTNELVIGFLAGIFLHYSDFGDKYNESILPVSAMIVFFLGIVEIILHFIQGPEFFFLPQRVKGFLQMLLFSTLLYGVLIFLGLFLSHKLRRNWPIIVTFIASSSIFINLWIFFPIIIIFILAILDFKDNIRSGIITSSWKLFILFPVLFTYYHWIWALAMSEWYAPGGYLVVVAIFSLPCFWYIGIAAKTCVKLDLPQRKIFYT